MDNNNKKLGFAGRLAKLFVMNSRLSILLIITLFAWGILSFVITPKQYNPEIVAPAFNVIVDYPGASSEEAYELVTKPLEDKIADIDGVDDVMSSTYDGGRSIVTAKFFVGEDMEDSKIKLARKISGNLDSIPIGATAPIIKNINPNDVPVLVMALGSDSFSPVALRKIALDIRDELKLVDNTTNIEVHGGKREVLKIKLNPLELNAQNISVYEIYEALQRSNSKMISGELKTPVGTKARDNILVTVDGEVSSVEDLRNMVLRTEGEHVVYLRDVAEIVEEAEETNNYLSFNKKDENFNNAVFISVAKKKGTNISSVTKRVLARLENYKKNKIPGDVKIDIVRDEGKTASEEVFGLVINLLQAIFIVSFILFIFLGKRAAFIVAIAIPLVLASVFGAGFLAGQTINRITLFALILSLGLLVDNATVVVENAVRHIKKKKSSKLHHLQKRTVSRAEYSKSEEGFNAHSTNLQINQDNRWAVIKAVDEVGVGLIMSTITTLFAFFPMAFVTGMMGPYMGPIPFFVPVALIFSLLIAFSINPFLSSVLLKAKTTKKEKANRSFFKLKKQTAIWKWKIMNTYKKLLSRLFLDRALRKKVLLITFVVFLAAMVLPFIGIVKFRMLPKADRDQFYIYLDFPEGTSVHKNKVVVDSLDDFLLKEKEIVSLQNFVGVAPVIDFNGLFKGSSARVGGNYTSIKVNLTHHDDRKIKSEKLVQELRPKIYKHLAKYPDLKIKLIEDPPGPPVMSTMLLKVKGRDYKKLKEISRDVEAMLAKTKGVVDTDTSRGETQEAVLLRVDYDKASRSGVSTEQIVRTMRIALAGQNISVVHSDSEKEQEYIFMQFDKEFRQDVDDLSNIYLSSKTGVKIPLLELVKTETGDAEDIIYSNNREKTIYINGEMGARGVTYAAIDMYWKLFKYHLPSNSAEIKKVSFSGIDYFDPTSGEEYSIEWGGEWKLTIEVFRDLGAAMIIAIFLIYLVLVAQFHSFRTPLLIMATIPLAMIGVLPGFAILGMINGIYFNATSMIGVIALAGIVVNNAIILMEYLNSFRRTGMTAEEALIKTGMTRMRPIVLTSLTTILGSLTIVADPVWAGLAWSIIFGISISTLLTLIIFPALYYNFEGNTWNCEAQKFCESHGMELK